MALNAESPAVSFPAMMSSHLTDRVYDTTAAVGSYSVAAGPYSEFAGTDADTTLTAAQVLGGFMSTATLTAGRTYTLPTAALLVAGIPRATPNQAIVFVVTRGAGAFALTLAAGSGGTLKGTAATAATASHGLIVTIVLTNITAGSEAYIAYSVGA